MACQRIVAATQRNGETIDGEYVISTSAQLQLRHVGGSGVPFGVILLDAGQGGSMTSKGTDPRLVPFLL